MPRNKTHECVDCGVVLLRTLTYCYDDGRLKKSWGKKGYYCVPCSIERWKKYLLSASDVVLYLTKRYTKLSSPLMQLIIKHSGVRRAEELIRKEARARPKEQRIVKIRCGPYRRIDHERAKQFTYCTPAHHWAVGDWTTTFAFQAQVKINGHNMAGPEGRRDAWFTDWHGQHWWGVSIGECDVLRCRKLLHEPCTSVSSTKGSFHVYTPLDYCTSEVAPLDYRY